VDENIAKTLRLKKKFEIEKLETEGQIVDEISRILVVLENQKKKEEEQKKEKARKESMGNVVSELKERMDRDKLKLMETQAIQELQVMEEGEIDQSDRGEDLNSADVAVVK